MKTGPSKNRLKLINYAFIFSDEVNIAIPFPLPVGGVDISQLIEGLESSVTTTDSLPDPDPEAESNGTIPSLPIASTSLPPPASPKKGIDVQPDTFVAVNLVSAKKQKCINIYMARVRD